MSGPDPKDKPRDDSAARETSVTPMETLRSLELDDVATPHGLAVRCLSASWRPLALLALVQGGLVVGLAAALAAGGQLPWLAPFLVPPVAVLTPLLVQLVGVRFLRHGPEPAAGALLGAVLRRARAGAELVVTTCLSFVLALLLAVPALIGAWGPRVGLILGVAVASGITGWIWLHVAARFALVEDAPRVALGAGARDGLRALGPLYTPGRRTWRRATRLALLTGMGLVLANLVGVVVGAVVSLLPMAPALAEAVTLLVYAAGTAFVVDGWILAWSYGYLSGEADRRARLAASAAVVSLPVGPEVTE